MTSSAVKKYQQNQTGYFTREEKDRLVIEYAPLVKIIASKISSRLPPSVPIDDLISAGILGLMDAIDKWDPSRETKLKTYAEFRIKGAILDELRAQDWVPRTVREKTKLIEKTIRELEQKLERCPRDEEIAEALNISMDEYYDLILDIRPVSMLSIDEAAMSDNEKKHLLNLLEAAKVNSPLFQLNMKAIKKIMTRAIEELPERMRFVLSLYYYEELNFREIAEIMNVSESRVSQLHTNAVLRLRAKVNQFLEASDLDIA
ncbi:MAG: FliA/WhiG family RNA polymerase sigma factor [Bdellovibrionaceae bacterium]|nr:FliA/WhiG family RNA polymerase sigma factor [Pseudobdellovibrionaceae bacterium]MDW8190724.1 FliA/WhiG family RNA polymerase sigma factor [Pseudobdellovibrionaceae bacterium]